jgi:hypothetical protein
MVNIMPEYLLDPKPNVLDSKVIEVPVRIGSEPPDLLRISGKYYIKSKNDKFGIHYRQVVPLPLAATVIKSAKKE